MDVLRYCFALLRVPEVMADGDAGEATAGCFALACLVLCRRGTVGWCCVLSCGVCVLVSAEVYGVTFPTWSEEFLSVLCSCGGDGCFSCFVIVLCVSHLSQLVSCRGIPPCCQWRGVHQPRRSTTFRLVC